MLNFFSAFLAPFLIIVGFLLLFTKKVLEKKLGEALTPHLEGRAFFFKSLGFWMMVIGVGMVVLRG